MIRVIFKGFPIKINGIYDKGSSESIKKSYDPLLMIRLFSGNPYNPYSSVRLPYVSQRIGED